jgi:hypothetical protein
VLGRVTDHTEVAWVMRQEYLLTSYVSTKAINPSGNAIANEIKAANSPSLASEAMTLKMGISLVLQDKASSRRSRGSPPVFGSKILLRKSVNPLNDVMYAWACVPLTGILKSLPAKTLLVPSNPPGTYLRKKSQGCAC